MIRGKEAFLGQYKTQPMFKDDLSEFDDSREVVMKLIDEYKAAEYPNYIDYGKPEEGGDNSSNY